MGWKKSAGAARRKPVSYAASAPAGAALRERPLGGSGIASGAPSAAIPEDARKAQPEQTAQPLDTGEQTRPRRDRRALPVYDVASGEDLETPVNLDNTLLQAMFPDLQIALGQVPPPPPRATAEQLEAHWQAALEDLAKDLAGQDGLALDVATGARKEGRFLFTDGQVGRQVADTFEKIMAYGGLLASPCLRPPQLVEGLRVLVVPEGEMGTGDCAGKMSAELAQLFDRDGSQAGQFRLGVRLDEDTILVGKGTLKRMHWTDVDEHGQGYDLILSDSSFKGNAPEFGEHTWDVHLGFVAWSGERRTKLSYQVLQWFDPALVEQCIIPRAETKIPLLLEAMASSEGARQFLQIEREDRVAEVRETERGDLEVEDAREPSTLEQVLAADVTGQMIDHPYVQKGLRRRLRQAWHDLAVGGGVKVPSFMGLPDSFAGQVDWLPEGTIVCPDLPPGEVLATRYPIRTKHDVQIWHNLDWQAFQKLGLEVGLYEREVSRFFRYAREHEGVAFMSHATAKRVGGDFDGDVFQLMPVTPHKPLGEIAKLNRDWSDLAPLVGQVRREGWGQGEITPKVKRRLATHVAPERPEEVTVENRRWLASAAIQQGGYRKQFLTDLGHHLDTQPLSAERKAEVVQTLTSVAGDPDRSLDETVEIAEAYGFDAHGWVSGREGDLFGLARRYNRTQAARQALKNMNSALGQIVYTVARVNASDRFTAEERERTIMRLAEELQAEVDKFKYDTSANMAYVDAVRQRVGRDLVWLDVHKAPDVFVGRTELSPSDDAVSHLWNHVSRRFRSWDRAPQPPQHFKDMLPARFSREQYVVARQQVRAYNRAIWRAVQADDEKALVSAIENLRSWSDTYTDPKERRVMAQAVWHAAHDNDRPGATASAAFQAFQPEVLAQLQKPQPRPMSEIVILGAQHAANLGELVTRYDQPQRVRIQVLLEDYIDTYGRKERRLAAYELDDSNALGLRVGYLPKDAPRREGNYLATLHRPKGKKRLEGIFTPLQQNACE